MKHLMLLRHAKTMPATPGMSDRDRPLAERGQRDARLMGEAIVEAGAPDLILVSPARRTRETLSGIQTSVSPTTRVVVVPEIYGAGGTYLDIIAAHGDDAARLLIIGHNPTIQATALIVAASGDKALRAELAAKFPTGSLFIGRLNIDDWTDIRPNRGELVAFIRPRDRGATDATD